MPRTAHNKNAHPPKVCERCGLPFEWRKKWARDWDNVKYCSEKCRRGWFPPIQPAGAVQPSDP